MVSFSSASYLLLRSCASQFRLGKVGANAFFFERCASSSAESSAELLINNNSNNKKVLTLNRPKSLNAMSLGMTRELMKELKSANSDPSSCDLVVIKGAGDNKAFCAGGDVLAVTKSYREKTSLYKDFFYEEYQLNHLIGTLKVPFVALMDGITMGGGCGVSVNGQFRVATERTILAMPETELGLFPDCGASHFLSHLPGKLGLFLGLSGHRLRGADAFHSGLATHYTESSNLGSLMQALLNLSSDECKEARVNDLLNSYHSKHRIPSFSLAPHLDTIHKCFTATSLEEVFRNLKEDGSAFSKEQLAVLHKMSPTSLKITFRQLEEGASLGFSEIFPVEYRLGQRFFEDTDFHEGCRAILVDKDRKPKWRPSRIEEVSRGTIDHYFSPFKNKSDELVIE